MSAALLSVFRKIKSHRIFLAAILVFRLRPINIARVFIYRRRLKHGFFSRALPCSLHVAAGDFWEQGPVRCDVPDVNSTLRQVMLARADEIVAGLFRRFEDEPIFEGERPQWYKAGYLDSRGQHFSTVAINHNPGEDVKLCWDLSRFKWLTQLVIAAVHTPSSSDSDKYLLRAHDLLSQWVENNKNFSGVNWACGQEVSIRGLHLMNSLLLLDKHFKVQPGEASIALLQASYQRVEATIGYSLSQENNHSLTESLFLYYAPFFLQYFGASTPVRDAARKRYSRFRNVFVRLTQGDGSFRMYSVNYHRAVCDILATAKVIDDALNVNFWTPDLTARIAKMHAFLSAVIVPSTGAAPAIGHNDGSLHVIQYAPYLCYTPSVLFMGGAFSLPVDSLFSAVQHQVYCFGRDIQFTAKVASSSVERFDDFGLIVIKQFHYQAYLKYARNKGRPQQQDFLHLDLWVRGQNVLHDSGSYSYNPENVELIDYFDDPTAHNGPFLIGQGFVARLSRFLYLEWPNAHVTESLGVDNVQVAVRLENSRGYILSRQLCLTSDCIHMVDTGPPGIEWGMSLNVPFVLAASSPTAPLQLAPGVMLACDQPLVFQPALYSKRYLDKHYGTRIIAGGSAAGIVTRIQIQDLS
ncbi:MAG: heparinase II/III family protein [Hafnia sp.]